VGCNYAQRVGPPIPTAIDGQNRRIPANPAGRSTLESVASVGFGFCLMKAAIFSAVPKPWFSTNLDDDGDVLQSDDVHFGNQARGVGIPIFVDHALSLEIGHIAERVLKLGEGANAA
jgi:hypothetical protein